MRMTMKTRTTCLQKNVANVLTGCFPKLARQLKADAESVSQCCTALNGPAVNDESVIEQQRGRQLREAAEEGELAAL